MELSFRSVGTIEQHGRWLPVAGITYDTMAAQLQPGEALAVVCNRGRRGQAAVTIDGGLAMASLLAMARRRELQIVDYYAVPAAAPAEGEAGVEDERLAAQA